MASVIPSGVLSIWVQDGIAERLSDHWSLSLRGGGGLTGRDDGYQLNR